MSESEAPPVRPPRERLITHPNLKPSASWVSDVGKVRTNNEDSVHVDERLGLFMVADGMGGYDAGEVASRMALDVVAEDLTAARETIIRVRFGEQPPDAMRELLAKAIRRACKEVYEASQNDPSKHKMGCTLTSLITLGDYALMGHVGDSRLYLVREGYMHQLSTDFTMAAELLRAGAITAEQAERSPYAHQLTRAIGIQPTVRVETLVLPLKAGDRFLICSDGITNELNDDEIREILARGEAARAPAKLLGAVLNRRAADNASGVVIEIAGNERTKRSYTTETIALDTLADFFLTEGMSIKDRARVLSFCDVTEHRAGTRLFEEGDILEQLVVCIDGELVVERDGRPIRTLEMDAHVGATTLIRGRPARASLVVTKPALVLELTAAGLRTLARRKPELGALVLNRLALRLSRELDQANIRLEDHLDEHALADPDTAV